MKSSLKQIAARLTALILAALAFVPSLALADGETPGGWEKVNGGMMVQPGEGYQASNLVAAAYAFIWLMVAIFVYTVWRRSQAVERDIEALRRQIDEKSRANAGARSSG